MRKVKFGTKDRKRGEGVKLSLVLKIANITETLDRTPAQRKLYSSIMLVLYNHLSAAGGMNKDPRPAKFII